MLSFEQATCGAAEPSDIFSEQTIDNLLDPSFWRRLCPFLTVGREFACDVVVGHKQNDLPIEKGQASNQTTSLIDRGYFKIETHATQSFKAISELLAIGVQRLIAYGFAPSFILMYDETWMLGEYSKILLESTSGNKPIGDWFVFHVDCATSGGYKPGPPHRDRPTGNVTSFHTPSGIPKYCSVWIALTDSTPENSCLYVLPRNCDDGYHDCGDSMASTLMSTRLWQNIVAQPLQAGGLFIFSHRLLHWGSTPEPESRDSTKLIRPRIALSMAFADKSFEEPYFDADLHLPFPPMGLRLGLVAGQSIQYEHLLSIEKHTLSFYQRIFHSQKVYFSENYFDKISSAAQFLRFMAKQSTSGEPRK